MSAPLRRSHAPIFWVLFGGGGMLAALFGPALVIVAGLQAPLNAGLPVDAMRYTNMLALLHHGLPCAALFALLSLLLWHAAHRILHSLHDLGIPAGRPARFACYGSALIATLVCAAALLKLLT